MAGTPWNKGKTGEAAGWDEARRKLASDKQKERIMQDPSRYYVMFRTGQQPHTWITGPDPKLKHLRLRWSRAKAQAKYWSQSWSLAWEQYRDVWVGHIDQQGRTDDSLNICRIDTAKGWTVKNVHLMNRLEAMHRKTKGHHRPRPVGMGKGTHHWRKNNRKTNTEGNK